MRNKTRAERKRDKLQCIGFIIVICACALASGLLEECPLIFGTAVLAGAVLVGGYLVWLGNQ